MDLKLNVCLFHPTATKTPAVWGEMKGGVRQCVRNRGLRACLAGRHGKSGSRVGWLQVCSETLKRSCLEEKILNDMRITLQGTS